MSNMLCIAKLTHTYCYYADDVVFQIWICHKIKATFSDFLRWLLLGIEIVIYIIYWPVKSHIRLTESMKSSRERTISLNSGPWTWNGLGHDNRGFLGKNWSQKHFEWLELCMFQVLGLIVSYLIEVNLCRVVFYWRRKINT